MKKPVVDYSKFRFSKLNTPEFSHLLLLVGWIVYFTLYFLTEKLIPTDDCFVVHSRVDDIIPFLEVFVIPYFLWYVLVAGSLLYFALYNVDSFKKLQCMIIFTQAVAMLVYILFPNMQNLRPDVLPRDNFLSDLVALLYRIDTNTNVCPSLHVGYSLVIASVWVREKGISKLFKAFVVVFVILVCLSTMFIKQHSFWDFVAAVPMCLAADFIFYRKWWRKKLIK